MFRVPYRWLPKTIWPNLRSMGIDIQIGVRNLWRWAPVIWFDADFDWEFLAALMETKLRWMAKSAEHWAAQGAERDRRQMLVCAEVLRRLRDSNWYFNQACLRFGDTSHAAKFAQEHARSDKNYLGLLIGKYLDHWWD